MSEAPKRRSGAELVAMAKQSVNNITPEQAQQEHESGAVFVDVRDSAEVAQGKIPGAVHLQRGMLEFTADPTSPYYNPALKSLDQRIVLYCGSGGRSAMATQLLESYGYTNVVNMDGGFSTWKGEDRPVELPE